MRRGSNLQSVESRCPPSIPNLLQPGEKTRTKPIKHVACCERRGEAALGVVVALVLLSIVNFCEFQSVVGETKPRRWVITLSLRRQFATCLGLLSKYLARWSGRKCALGPGGAIDKGGGEVRSRSEAHGRYCRRWQLFRGQNGASSKRTAEAVVDQVGRTAQQVAPVVTALAN